MKFEFFVAKRYLFKGRGNRFLSTISLVSITGIAIGTAALIIALSLLNGFQGDIRNKILSSTAHIMINNVIGEGFDGYDELITRIKKQHKEVVSASPVVYGTVLLKGPEPNASGAVLRGVDLVSPNREDTAWAKKLRTGELPLKKKQLIVGAEIAKRVGLTGGQSCTVITSKPVLSPAGLIPKVKKMHVSGVFKTGLYEVDNGTIVTNLEEAQKLFGLKNKANYIQVYLEDMFDVDRVAASLKETVPPFLGVITWKDLNASLYSALELEKTILFFTLTLIIIVASLNIVAGLILLVIRKIKDIGILLSYGAAPRTIRRIFFIQGSIIGILGTAIGSGLGLLFCYFANTFELIKVPSEIYQMSFVPFKTGLFDFFAVVTVTLLITFTATLIPTKKAASVNVVEAIKDE
ncbi:MAG: ABC transporter permease [bacterium]|nr:ABC transporter permease [bacterium]